MEKVCFFGGWVPLSSAVADYIVPTAVADAGMVCYFGWMAPGWQQTAALEESRVPTQIFETWQLVICVQKKCLNWSMLEL